MNKIGRPRKPRTVENLNLSSFKEEIRMFKNSLIDCIDEDDMNKEYIPYIKHFLQLDKWQQNLFIVYLIFKYRKKTIKEMAELLNINSKDILSAIKDIKKELKNNDNI